MKLVLLLALFVYGSLFAQEKIRIEQSDIVFKNGQVTKMSTPISLVKADKELAKVPIMLSFSDTIYTATNMTIDKINNMIVTANYNAMNGCKNTYTYIPRDIHIYFSPEYDIWSVSLAYTAQNDYGATKDGRAYTEFNKSGDRKLTDFEVQEIYNKNKPKKPVVETIKERRLRHREEAKLKKE